ncbi:MAG: NADPH-dependent 7-cyano-7-deazaguanine reductase QueF [Pseudomonadota bacterium]
MSHTGFGAEAEAESDQVELDKSTLDKGVLGKATSYPSTYTPSLLHSLLRADTRREAGLSTVVTAAVKGEDLWTGYEFSWLDNQGKPMVAALRLRIPCQSDAVVESKSLKLYLNSYAQTRFDTRAEVLRTLDGDLSLAFRSPILVELIDLQQLNVDVAQLSGMCLDDLDVFIKTYERDPQLLALEESEVEVSEAFYTDLFRSLCPVTGQPDWASVAVEYTGPAIQRDSLLRYLVSYRNHQAFHETTIEQIYADLLNRCKPRRLSVYGRFQRRGGLDINPIRANYAISAPVARLPRQ